MADNFLAGQASLWVQPNGPNSEPKYLGCHSIGDIPEPKGDTTVLWCPDPAQSGRFVTKNSFQGEPGTITTSIETDLRSTADYLEDLANGCAFPIYVHKVMSGRRDVFSNFDRSFVMRRVKITTQTLSGLAARNPADEGESTQSFDLSVEEVLRCFNLECSRVSVSETEAFTGLAVAGQLVCESGSEIAQKPEDYLWLASKALTGSASNTADVLESVKGAAFAATAADPFGGGEDISAIAAFKIGRETTRILVTRGTTDGANPAEVAYSDDDGATWTAVNVGSTNGEFVPSPNSLVALDLYHIWLGTDLGRIYFSSDGGVTWAVQENAVINTVDIMGIDFYDVDYGIAIYEDGDIAVTTDGETWSAGTTSGLTNGKDVAMVSPSRAWAVGTEGMFYTLDGGVTWAQRNSYDVDAVDFLNEHFGIAAGGAASNASIWSTIDGGYNWMTLPAVANSGFVFVKVISTKLAYVTGNINSATGFLGKIQPVA